MPFVYYGQGVAGYYDDFLERLMSRLALEGTEITGEARQDGKATMDVRHTGEQGKLEVTASGKNVKVTYTVAREKKEVGRGVMGAIAGAGVGSILGGILRRDGGEIGDRIGDALGGAAAGGAYGAYDGWDESREDRTAFAALLASCVKDVEDELQEIMNAQEEAREALRERGRQRKAEEDEKEEEVRGELEDVLGDLLAVQEEIVLLESEGQEVSKAKSRTGRADKLYQEAESACDEGNYTTVRTKLKAARAMIDAAREMLNE